MNVMQRRIAIAVLAVLAGLNAAGAQEVGSAKVVPIQVTGDPAARFSLVILGDGYTAADMPRFRAHVDKHLNIMWSLEPFRSYRNYINVYAVEIVSGQSGITCDPEVREPRTTPLSMQFGGGCQNINARGITGNNEAARTFARMATPNFDQILVINNTDTYGGIGGAIATTSGGNALGPYITPHEIGHSLGRLQDEYTYSARGRPGDAFTATAEPPSIHHTLLTEEQMRTQQQKWYRWLGEESESGGKIARYEGGQSRTSGIWRPSKHSMMISLGYYFDQVSRERMTQKISGNVELIAASTPAGPIAPTDIIWIETAHPVYHELNITWQVDGQPVAPANNARNLSLAALKLPAGQHTVSVKVVDPTEYVRDPAVRDTSLSASRSWTVTPGLTSAAASSPVAFTASTQTTRPVGRNDVVYVETTHPHDRILNVSWKLDGRTIANPANSRTLRLADQQLAAGTHTLSATVSDPANASAQGQTLNWTVDATGPTVKFTLSEPVAALTAATTHYFMRDQFTMKLEPTDDQPGYVVAEFRVNGDGWHHYYGWPDAAPGTPFLFTPRGTVIKELVYGSLSSEGLSPQPWEAREPGWGTHRIEYRARDAAGNIGATKDFRVTFMPVPTCTQTVTGNHSGALQVTTGVTCLNNATVNGNVTVAQGASLVANKGTITGTLTANGAQSVELVGTAVDGAVNIAGTTGSVTIFGANLKRDVTLSNNATVKAPAVIGSTIGGVFNCTGNKAAPQNFGTANTVRGNTGSQCR